MKVNRLLRLKKKYLKEGYKLGLRENVRKSSYEGIKDEIYYALQTLSEDWELYAKAIKNEDAASLRELKAKCYDILDGLEALPF